MTRRFSVGQRVRVIGCCHPKSLPLIGQITHVVGFVWDGRIAVDLPRLLDELPYAVFEPYHLEPLDDDDREPGSWSALADIWQPRKAAS